MSQHQVDLLVGATPIRQQANKQPSKLPKVTCCITTRLFLARQMLAGQEFTTTTLIIINISRIIRTPSTMHHSTISRVLLVLVVELTSVEANIIQECLIISNNRSNKRERRRIKFIISTILEASLPKVNQFLTPKMSAKIVIISSNTRPSKAVTITVVATDT